MARPRARTGNLPQELTTFVGRRRELGELRQKLATARLVSLVGPGGVGKTRLGLRLAADLSRGFADGAWLVELGEIRDQALVANAVAGALDLRDQTGTRPLEILTAHLPDRHLLLVLDNCEHLLEAAARLVAAILAAAPGVRVLATSREPLGVPGEQVFLVPPLHLPGEEGAEPLARLRENEAVALFSERAAAASGRFELTESNREAVAALCRRLDGLPLAIELAAVRTRALDASQILGRLNDRFRLLAGGPRAAHPRHQTLETTIDWSYGLLTAAEQSLLRRLGVFAGRFTLDDAESVCASDDLPRDRVLDLLSSLIDRSLVSREDFGGRTCYRLHETMRDYALERLRQMNEEGVWCERSLDHYRRACSSSAGQARFRLPEWLPWVELEIDNLRAVLQRCVVAGDAARGLEIVTSLRLYWVMRGTTEGMRWLDQLLAAGKGPGTAPWAAQHLKAWLHLVQGDPGAARPWAGRALAAARKSNDPRPLSESLSTAVIAETTAGDPGAARPLLEEAECVTAQLGDHGARVDLLEARAIHAFFVTDLDTARAASLEGARLCRAAGDLYHLESMLRNLGVAAMVAGDARGSRPYLLQALVVAREIDNRVAQFYLLSALSWHAARSRQASVAARLLGAAEAIGTGAGATIIGPHVVFLTQARESALAALGEERFGVEHEAGAHLPRAAALRLALGEPDPAKSERTGGAGPGPLGRREAEVANLIADGLTNRQIASRLFISEPTVATHVRHILNKLGVDSRAQIARWVAAEQQ